MRIDTVYSNHILTFHVAYTFFYPESHENVHFRKILRSKITIQRIMYQLIPKVIYATKYMDLIFFS